MHVPHTAKWCNGHQRGLQQWCHNVIPYPVHAFATESQGSRRLAHPHISTVKYMSLSLLSLLRRLQEALIVSRLLRELAEAAI